MKETVRNNSGQNSFDSPPESIFTPLHATHLPLLHTITYIIASVVSGVTNWYHIAD